MADGELLGDINCSLTELQDELIQYEQANATSPRDALRESLQLFMRRAHSLKGKLRLAERPFSATLIHSVESLLERHIDAERHLARSALDRVLDSLDAVAVSLVLDREDEPRLRTMSSSVETLTGGLVVDQQKPRSFPFAVDESEYASLDLAKARGWQVYCVEKAIRTDLPESTFEQLPIRQDLEGAGGLIAVRPRFKELDRKRSEAIVVFVAVTQLSRQELDLTIFDSWSFCQWPAQPAKSADAIASAKVVAYEPTATTQLSRILIVEDDPTSRLVLSEMLRRFGQREIACDGRDAVTLIRQALEAGQGYELICLDIMLPELDGMEVLQELRRLERTCQPKAREVRAKVVMTTALADYEHFHGAFAKECDSYLVKPITRVALDRQLARLGIAPATNL